MPSISAKFVMEQLRMSTMPAKARRWSDATKSLALQLKNASPKAYRILQKFFYLPSIRTLENILKKVNISEGWHASILYALKHEAKSMKPEDRLVMLCFDEISLKRSVSYDVSNDRIEGIDESGQPVDHAGVFMIRSINGKWKQPFGYFLTSGTMKSHILKNRIEESVKQILATGFIPAVFVMDQGSNNTSAFRQLGVTREKPFFNVENNKIYSMYDIPHLTKSIRNNFRKHGFYVGSNNDLADWSYLVELFKQDQARDIRMCPRLTKQHLFLTAFSTMTVSLATQVRILANSNVSS